MRMRDGGGLRAFVVACDACGAELTAPTLEESDRQRRESGWSPAGISRDLCPGCVEPPRYRRFASSYASEPRARRFA
jgi:hypothetical protein